MADGPGGRRPNVVLINCDDLGYGDLGCYGSDRNATPAIDRLASEGLRLDSFYMASPACSPSRGAMLTGCYPPRIGFGSFDGLPVLFPGQPVGLDPSEVTVASSLRDVGYRTQIIGKWHCGDQPAFLPTNHGFDHYFGLPYSNDMGRQAPMAGVDRSTDLFRTMPPLPLLDDTEVLEQQPDQASLTERYVTEAVRFLRSAQDGPFFLYLAHLYVHVPIYVQQRFAEGSRNGRYGAAVEAIDWATDVILRELDALGLTDDTIVIFTSDNGSRARDEGGSNAPLRGHKAQTWEGGMRVPCIVRWPGRIAAGATSDAVVTGMDLFPTLAALCGGAVPTDRTIDGRDVSALWLDGAAPPEVPLLYYWMNDLEAVRVGRWKLHIAKYTRPVAALYDLEADVGETVDRYADEPEVVAHLEAVAEQARATLGDALTDRVGADVRPIGRVDDARPLTTYDPDHPYYVAEYDLPDRG
jgi:arylsulfatase A-like enzyme